MYFQVISTTTINPIPTNYFPIHAKDLLAAAAASTKTAASLFNNNNNNTHAKSNFSTSASSSPTTSSLSAKQEVNTNADCAPIVAPPPASNVDIKQQPVVPTHGRRLRQRPPKSSPNTSRRNSVSSNQSSTSSSTTSATASQQIQNVQQSHEDLKQTVNKYFGIVNRIESGEQFSIRAKRLLPNGQMQYLIEWGEQQQPSPVIVAPPTTPTAALGTTVAHVAETTTTSNDIIQQNDADSQLALTHNNGQVTDEMSVN